METGREQLKIKESQVEALSKVQFKMNKVNSSKEKVFDVRTVLAGNKIFQ